jgi:glutamate-1-semialdehyde 2,1-aminomutase
MGKQKIVAIIQARLGSTRLPEKVLKDLDGKPLLSWVVERAIQARSLDAVCVATTDQPEDDRIAELANELGVQAFRGSEQNVLDRYYQAAKQLNAQVVVRLTGDCPFLDPKVIDNVVDAFLEGDCDYASNTLRPTYPDGLDTEVFTMQALERAWREATLPSEREHVTPYIRKKPEIFRLHNVTQEQDLSDFRLTVDEPADLELARLVAKQFARKEFCTDEVVAFLRERTEVANLNKSIGRDEGYLRSLKTEGRGAKNALNPQGRGQRLYCRAKEIIPGGTQLLSKRPEMFLPELWPAYYAKAKGAEVWDMDGNRYLDMSYSGIGTLILGAADPDVEEAVIKAVKAGSMSTLNCPEEVELAELLLELHPWADMVRYARCGGEAMAVAVRIARAATGRSAIAVCGYHGWHDWYLAANLAKDDALVGHLLPGLDPAGVPSGLTGTIHTFHYNNLEEFRALMDAHGDSLAAVVMEPVRGHEPMPGFLQEIRETATRAGAALVFDEVSAGFRLTVGGAHLCYGVEPDVAVFAKAMSNGYPMAAVIGRKEFMQAAQGTFISSTYWTERIGPTAALATIRKCRELDVPSHLIAVGREVKKAWIETAMCHGLEIEVGGMDPLSHFTFKTPEPLVAHTYFTQCMLERGFLATKAFYASYAHTFEHVQRFADALDETFAAVAEAIAQGDMDQRLKGPIAHAGFQRLN